MDTEVLDRPKVPVTARPKTTADILEAAALVIEEFGWHQGGIGNIKDGFCGVGALYVADVGGTRGFLSSRGQDAHIALMKVVGLLGPQGFGPGFNDTPGRQAYEVTAALREAAKRARAVTTRSAQDGS